MRWLIWGVTLVVLGVWTLLAAVAAGLAAWLAQNGPALVVAASESDARLQLAVWLDSGWTHWIREWIPSAALEPLRQGVEALTGLLQMAWPWLGGLLGWVAPLVWVIWGLGALFVVVLAGGLHLWLARRARPAVRV